MKTENVSIGKEKILYDLHHNNKLLILPNVWDPLTAAMLVDIGYPAIATASASIAYSNGYLDGQNIPFDDLLKILQRIVQSVNVPVTADVESGYADNNKKLAENIKKLVAIGIVGINFEDTYPGGDELIDMDEQCEKISLIKRTSVEAGIPLFINARTDVFMTKNVTSGEETLTEAIRRGKAYKQAGADCFYPIALKDANALETIVKEVALPVNILMIPGIPGFAELQKMGVARLSTGPGFLKRAMYTLKNTAEKLLNFDGQNEMTNNTITSEYLINLVKNKSNEKN